MAFVKIESWIAPVSRPSAIQVPAWLGHRWTTRGTALVLSVGIDIGLVAVLLTMGDVGPRSVQREIQSIATIDIASNALQATSSAASPSAASTSPTPPTKIDATTAPPVPKEWAVTTLPAVATSEPRLTPPAPPAVAKAVDPGSGSTGKATGAGYNPFAYASYRAPPNSISVSPDALQRLEMVLRERIVGTGVEIAAQVEIDGQGRVVRFVAPPGMTPTMAAAVSSAVLGFALCCPDPRRPPISDVTITLRV